jgi:hypothetical protein
MCILIVLSAAVKSLRRYSFHSRVTMTVISGKYDDGQNIFLKKSHEARH